MNVFLLKLWRLLYCSDCDKRMNDEEINFCPDCGSALEEFD